MNTNEWVAVIGCSIALLTAIYSVIRFVTKSIMAELLPNSGKSMRDELRVLSKRVDEIYSILSQRGGGQ
jgi:hypothetical protein